MEVRGYQNTSLDDVLRESGVGKGNFYHHFRSKEDLGYAILDQIISSFLERTLEPCFSDLEGHRLNQIRCFLARVLEYQRERRCVGGCAMGNLASELSDVHEGFRARLASVFTAWQERLTLVLREAQTRERWYRDVSRRGVPLPGGRARGLHPAVEGHQEHRSHGAVRLEIERYLALYEVRS
jgi:TetR/AcrR family transcriptional repressor of nem operon